MESLAYLFDSSGNWLAFRKGIFVFSPTGAWIGWVGEDGVNVFDVDGSYFGTIVAKDRLFRSLYPEQWKNANHPGYPGREDEPDHPGYPGRYDVPPAMENVNLFEHA